LLVVPTSNTGISQGASPKIQQGKSISPLKQSR